MLSKFNPFSAFGYPVNPDPWTYGLGKGPSGGPSAGPGNGPKSYSPTYSSSYPPQARTRNGTFRKSSRNSRGYGRGSQPSTGRGYKAYRRTLGFDSSFSQRFLDQLSLTTGRKLIQHKFFDRVREATPGYTHYWGYDVGLAGSGLTWTQGGKALPGTDGDLLAIPKLSDGSITSASTNKMTVNNSTAHITIRNQGNFGIHLKVYYIKSPIANAIPAEDTINEILNASIPTLRSIDDTQHSDLTDYSDLPKKITIVSRRLLTLMPGETKNFRVNTFVKGFHSVASVNFRTRNKFTRSIVFQMTGFPIHDQTSSLEVNTSPIHVDFIGTWRGKG